MTQQGHPHTPTAAGGPRDDSPDADTSALLDEPASGDPTARPAPDPAPGDDEYEPI